MPKSKSIEWVEIARRVKNHPNMLIDIMADCLGNGRTARALELPLRIRYYRQFDYARWLDRSDIESYTDLLKKQEAKSPGYLRRIAKKMYRLECQFVAFSRTLQSRPYATMTDKQLARLFDTFLTKNEEIVCLDYTYISLNRFYPDMLAEFVAMKEPDVNKQNELLRTLFAIDRQTEIREEKEAILKLAQRVKRSGWTASIDRAIKQHTTKYDYLGMYIFLGKPYTVRDIRKRVRHLTVKNLKDEFRDLTEQKKNKAQTATIMSDLQFGKRERLMVSTIKEWTFTINNLEEAWNKGLVLAQPLIGEICRRLKLKWEEFRELLMREALQAIRAGKVEPDLRRKIRLRQKDSILIMEYGKTRILEGKDRLAYERREKRHERSVRHIKRLNGQPASQGSASGRVRVIISIDDIKRFRKGEILVAPATTPLHVPAMEKAQAIVTNEGGLLCHAAIVSRELDIPCIIGTKNATQVFKNGDRVEVDATHGTVKKL